LRKKLRSTGKQQQVWRRLRRRQIFGSKVANFCERRRSALEKNKRRRRKEEDG
jgi:hypothetical protein